MNRLQSFVFIAIAATLTIFNSCTKNHDHDTTAVTDNAMAENESNLIIGAINNVAYSENVNRMADVRDAEDLDSLPGCATVTIDTSSAVKMITIDFGSTPCLCDTWDGKYRMGKIIATWTGPYRAEGTVITITTQDYYAGYNANALNKFDFLKTVTNMGYNINGNLHYAIDVSTALVTLPTGQTISWTSQRDREWVEGEPTWLPFDDVYSITGSASGTDRNGKPFTVIIINPVIVKIACAWISKGTLEITHGNLPTATLDYGDGTCDDQATITIDGVTHTITLE